MVHGEVPAVYDIHPVIVAAALPDDTEIAYIYLLAFNIDKGPVRAVLEDNPVDLDIAAPHKAHEIGLRPIPKVRSPVQFGPVHYTAPHDADIRGVLPVETSVHHSAARDIDGGIAGDIENLCARQDVYAGLKVDDICSSFGQRCQDILGGMVPRLYIMDLRIPEIRRLDIV